MRIAKIILIVACCLPLTAQAMHDPKLNKEILESWKKIREQREKNAQTIQELEDIYPEYQEHKHERKFI